MTPSLVIFDCDGVLVDSEVIACRIDAQCLTEAGFPTTTEEVMQRYVGRSATFMLADIEARHRRTLPQGFSAMMHEHLTTAFERELRAVEGVADVVSQITCAKCVASSSTPERIERTLRITGLLCHFRPHLFSATQVAHGKPAPDLFLFAAAQMGVSTKDCVVVEDSIVGVEAARAAGTRVIGFAGGGHCPPDHADALRAAGADTVIDRMADFARAIKVN